MRIATWLAAFETKCSVGSQRAASARRRQQPRSVRAAYVESLAPRTMLSISSLFNATSGVLSVTSNGSDAISVGADQAGKVTLNGSVLTASLAAGGTGQVSASAVTSLTVTGGAGANSIDLSGVTSAAFPNLTGTTINAGDGNDSVIGSGKNDSIDGGLGNDTIGGGLGNDLLKGSDGRDLMDGGAGNDTIDGGTETDTETIALCTGVTGAARVG